MTVKVLHIHTLPVISGSGINTHLTMKGLDREIFEVELACAPGGPLIERVRADGITVHPFGRLVQPLKPSRDIGALRDLSIFLRRNPYHIVHTHNSKAGFLGRLAARLARVPVVVHSVHGFAFHDRESACRRLLFRNLERLAAHWCDKMIFISQPLIDWALRERIAAPEKIVKIYSGIELDRFRPVPEEEKLRIREAWNIDPQVPVIGMVSKLWEGKGHRVLLEAFGKIRVEFPDAVLLIVGEGYLLDSLRRQAEGSGLRDAVLFTGFQPDVSRLTATFDVAVLPSFFEGMGRVLLEAMAMAKPVVASRVGGIPELVRHGENGFLVRPGDADALAGALMKTLRDRSLAGRMGQRGQEKIRDCFSAEAMVRSIEKVYRQLLARKGIPLGT